LSLPYTKMKNIKKRVAYYFLSFAAILMSLLLCSCFGGGDVSSNGAAVSGQKVPLNIKFALSGSANAIAPDAAGSVEIQIYRNPPPDPDYPDETHGKVLMGVYSYAYSARKARIEVFANETYSISIAARIRTASNDTSESVYESDSDIFVSTPGQTFDPSAGPLKSQLTMPLNFSHSEALSVSGLEFASALPQIIATEQKVPSMTVRVLDQQDNLFTGYNGTVEIRVGGIKNGVTGETIVNAVGGVAKFDNIRLASSIPQDNDYIYFRAGAQRIFRESDYVYLQRPGSFQTVAYLGFTKEPPVIISRNSIISDFSVIIKDSNEILIDTSETVMISASNGALNGAVSVKASHGIAVFKGISAVSAGDAVFKASCGPASIESGVKKIMDGKMYNSTVIIYTASYICCYDFSYSPDGDKMDIGLALRWAREIGGIVSVKPNSFGDALYVLSQYSNGYYNTFYAITKLSQGQLPDINPTDLTSIQLPRDNLSGTSAIQQIQWVTGFAPARDDLSVYLCTADTVYKWRRINKPWLVSSMARSKDWNMINDVVEYSNNQLAATTNWNYNQYPPPTNGYVKFFDFNEFPPVERTSFAINGFPDTLDASPDGRNIFVSEGNGNNFYRIRSADNTLIKTPLGPPGVAGGSSYFKYLESNGSRIAFLERSTEGSIFSYDFASGTGSAIVVGTNKLVPAGIAFSKDGRILLAPSGDAANPFLRAIDLTTNSWLGDFTLKDDYGYILPEKVMGIIVL